MTSIAERNKELELEEEPFGLGCALESFIEVNEVLEMIDNLKNIYLDKSHNEKAYEKFQIIIGQYKQQPHLLDSHLDRLLERLISIIRDSQNSMELRHHVFKYMFVLVNVRGYKVIVRQLPHEVSDFEKVLQLLEVQDPSDADTWTTRYVLLLWMSIIIMIPFDLNRFDGFMNNGESQQTVMNRILTLIQKYILVPDKCRDAASYLSSLFLIRNDVKEAYLTSYLEWATKLCLQEDSTVFVKCGTLASIATILKLGKRDDLLPHAQNLLRWIVNGEIRSNNGTNVQKLVYKIIQRIGLVFLPPRVASWRYLRGNRSLTANLSGGDTHASTTNVIPEDEEADIDVPDEVEEVIDQLIHGLESIDGIVRWSAAKGVGRVTGRLPQDMADDVLASILELFSPRQGDSAWHGGCLALAELGRRGLLLPKRLPEVVPLIMKALVYDEPKGYSSVGSHIRDAACYVCWSFARAYDMTDLKPFVHDIASTLLIVACFDREINCRRAASAAFQENVGRQGTFPHGIDILTVADFFAVSVRNNSYLKISVHIAQYKEYTQSLIDHLIHRKINHWDLIIRELTAKALCKLTTASSQYMGQKVLPFLFEKAYNIDLNSRHGAILAIGNILYALSQIDHLATLVPGELLDATRDLIPNYRRKLYFRGMGGELMRQASCDFIEKCCLTRYNFKNDVADDWLNLLNECIAFNVVNIRNIAVNTLPILLNQYYNSNSHCGEIDDLVKKYIHELLNTNSQDNRMGHALALGCLPKFVLKSHLPMIIDALVESTIIKPHTSKWAEARRDAVKALSTISSTLEEEMGKLFDCELILGMYHVFFEGLLDYTQDKRGDVGAWVREASMNALQNITSRTVTRYPKILTEKLVTRIFGGVVQQAVEKIDRTRALAGRVFYNLLYNVPSVPNVPFYNNLIKIFPKNNCDNNINWNSASYTFPKFVQIIQFEPYSYHVMLGLMSSVGGLTETLVKNSSSAFFSYLKMQCKSELERLLEIICTIFSNYQKNERVVLQILKFLDKSLNSSCFSTVLEDSNLDFSKRLLKLVLNEISGCRDIYKLIDGIHVLINFIQIQETCETALVQTSIFLCHRQPFIRKSTATLFYETLMIYEDKIYLNNVDKIMNILGTTNWEETPENLRPVRNNICQLMGIRVPIAKVKM